MHLTMEPRSIYLILNIKFSKVQPPIQWVPGALSLGVKRPEHEADHSLPSSTEVKEWVKLYLHSPNTPSWRGAELKKHRGNFTFTSSEFQYREKAPYYYSCQNNPLVLSVFHVSSVSVPQAVFVNSFIQKKSFTFVSRTKEFYHLENHNF
jgi:hypothetical protein